MKKIVLIILAVIVLLIGLISCQDDPFTIKIYDKELIFIDGITSMQNTNTGTYVLWDISSEVPAGSLYALVAMASDGAQEVGVQSENDLYQVVYTQNTHIWRGAKIKLDGSRKVKIKDTTTSGNNYYSYYGYWK